VRPQGDKMRTSYTRAIRIALTVLVLPPAMLHAQEKVAVATYRAGLKSIAIPAPTSELSEIGPDYRVLFEPLVADSNRLIAAFTTSDDAAAMRAGKSEGMKEYALVEVLRRAEFTTVTPELFKQVEDTMATQFGTTLNSTLKDQQDELNHKLKAAIGDSATAVNLEKPVQLGVLFSKPDACGFAVVMPVSAKGNNMKMVAGVTVLRVQERLIYAYLYTRYNDEESMQWIRKTAEGWADSILAANK
jgi:hypothetical protein